MQLPFNKRLALLQQSQHALLIKKNKKKKLMETVYLAAIKIPC